MALFATGKYFDSLIILSIFFSHQKPFCAVERIWLYFTAFQNEHGYDLSSG